MSGSAGKAEGTDVTVGTAQQRVLWAFQVAVLLGVVWLALAGFGDWPIGALLAILAAALGAWLVPGEVYPWRPLRLLTFFVWFVWASWWGGVDVARRALAPRLSVVPVLHRHRLLLPAGLPRTVFVAVLSLLPGTLSVELEQGDDGDVLVVHALVTAAIAGVAPLERRVAWLFSLPEAQA